MSTNLSVSDITAFILSAYSHLAPQNTWGELSFFYNRDHLLPRGTYFCTLKEKDGENDSASNLNREGVFRLCVGIGKPAFKNTFGYVPERPSKGKTITPPPGFEKVDFTVLNKIMPHPVYGWMGWVVISNPAWENFDKIKPLLDIAYENAEAAFNKRV